MLRISLIVSDGYEGSEVLGVQKGTAVLASRFAFVECQRTGVLGCKRGEDFVAFKVVYVRL